MKTKTVQILGDTDIEKNIISDPVQAGGYYSMSSGKHTLVVYTGTSFKGRISLQGTLLKEPKEEDWFNIKLDGQEYIEFPFVENNIAISNNKVYTFNFTAVPVYIRFILDREYLDYREKRPMDLADFDIYGNLRKVLLVY